LPNTADAYCPECRQPLNELPAAQPIPTAHAADQGADVGSEHAIARLQERVANLEWRLRRSGIYSESFLQRAFAIWGHFIVAHLLLILALAVPLGILSAVFSGR
jgi:hypothetical protein